jgi:hypothetical protein
MTDQRRPAGIVSADDVRASGAVYFRLGSITSF